MCRHLAYVGDPLPLGQLLSAPAHSLVHQSWAPEHQRSGTVNADGFGVGWYADDDPVPARYRRTGPIWADLTFPDLARVIHTRTLLAAVRDATLPGADGEAAAAPFASGRWLFSHNGAVKNWPHSMAPLAATLPAADLLSLEARTDSAFVWALVLARLTRTRAGAGAGSLGDALAGAVIEIAEAAPSSRLNLLVTDGTSIAATAWGDSLWYLLDPGRGAVVASEPYDTDPAWQEVPDATLLTATRTEVLLTPIKDLSAPKEPRP
ncbi:ergothioneine biosynthesis protein EgtC [Streptomyces sp. 4F14]|uniref:ergothioneine biosynthesis protein EgtC n=1 Tax=Streptomyces sp. 4F14 TaxID=3394380 RepID=UPI003A8874CF